MSTLQSFIALQWKAAMRLLDLPNEIIHLVWEAVVCNPRDVASFAATCSQVYQLGRIALEQHRLHREWIHLDISDLQRRPLAVDFLWHLIRQPQAAVHVEEICFSTDKDYSTLMPLWEWLMQFYFKIDAHSQALHSIDRDLEKHPNWAALKRIIPYLYANFNDVGDVAQETVGLVLLSALCPRLTKLRVIGCEGIHEIEAIITTAEHRQTCFGELKEIELIHPETLGSDPLSTLGSMSRWPTIRSLRTWKAGGEFDPATLPPDLPESKVEEVTLANSSLDDHTIRAFITPMPCLRSFTYQHGEPGVYDTRSSIRHICNAVQEVAGDYLEHLSLTMYDRDRNIIEFSDTTHYYNLKGFTKLKVLEFKARWWLPEGPYSDDEAEEAIIPPNPGCHNDGGTDGIEDLDLHQYLPKSIEVVRLDTNDAMAEFYQMVKDIGKHRSTYLPELKHIGLSCCDHELELEESAKILMSAGVEYKRLRDELTASKIPLDFFDEFDDSAFAISPDIRQLPTRLDGTDFQAPLVS